MTQTNDPDTGHFDYCVFRVERVAGRRVASALRGNGSMIATAERDQRLLIRTVYWGLAALLCIGVVVLTIWLMLKIPERYHSSVGPAFTGFSLLLTVGLALRFAPFRPVRLLFSNDADGFVLTLFDRGLTHVTYRAVEAAGETRGYIVRRGLLGQGYCFAEDLNASAVELVPRSQEAGAIGRSLLHQTGLGHSEIALGKQANGWDIILVSDVRKLQDREQAELGWIQPVHADLGQFELKIDKDETRCADRGLLCATAMLALLEGVKPAKNAKDYLNNFRKE